jgi:hypothetical protein
MCVSDQTQSQALWLGTLVTEVEEKFRVVQFWNSKEG